MSHTDTTLAPLAKICKPVSVAIHNTSLYSTNLSQWRTVQTVSKEAKHWNVALTLSIRGVGLCVMYQNEQMRISHSTVILLRDSEGALYRAGLTHWTGVPFSNTVGLLEFPIVRRHLMDKKRELTWKQWKQTFQLKRNIHCKYVMKKNTSQTSQAMVVHLHPANLIRWVHVTSMKGEGMASSKTNVKLYT